MSIRKPFKFKQFDIYQDKTTMKVGTDGVLLGAWVTVNTTTRILDIGTGTGLIALMLAQRNETAQITAVELEEAAFLQAKENFELSKWRNRLVVFRNSIQTFSSDYDNSINQFDLIVSNPPFFNNSTKSKNKLKNQARHTETLPFSALIEAVKQLLLPNGKFCLILPFEEGNVFIALAKAEGLFCTQKVNVKGRDFKPVERLLLQFERIEKPISETNLTIQNSPTRHDYTAEYVELTKGFYLMM